MEQYSEYSTGESNLEETITKAPKDLLGPNRKILGLTKGLITQNYMLKKHLNNVGLTK